MSHTTTVTDIVITDIDALRAAVQELSRNGVPVSLKDGGTPRAFYPNQAGLGPAAHVVVVGGGCPYDVGVYRNASNTGYELRTDLFAGSVAKVLGGKGNSSAAQQALGKLYQMYAVHAATRQAVKQGLTVRRSAKADGTVQLVVGGYK